jgi:isopentenyl diphosphate isomerase/L-lactate dehydrogenase-like FMN-dependent dehydrogenase
VSELIDNDREWATLELIHQKAIAALDPTTREFLEGGSGSEVTLKRNMSAFDSVGFATTTMSGRGFPGLSTSLLGIDLHLPILTAPFGADKLFHSEGQKAVTRAAQAVGVASIVPEASSFSLETLAEGAPKAAVIGQFHPLGTDENFLKMLHRYEDAGYQALCLTVDCPTPGWREHNLRNGYVITQDVVGGNYPPGGEVAMQEALGQLYAHKEPVWSWEKISGLMRTTKLPWIVKGILTARDARAAINAGASVIYVSNHGGRQLDGVQATIEALPAIVAEVAGEVPVILDSGIRRGSDVVKAIALGATAVVIGRLAAYGLASGGQQGVERVFKLLEREMQIVLQLLGAGSIRELTSDAVIELKGVA